MPLFLSGRDVNDDYHLACYYLYPSYLYLTTEEHWDFLNMFDGCAFE